MILDIIKYGNKSLSKRAEPILRFDQALRKLVDDMFETMYASSGAGLAATQVGVLKRLFVMDCHNAAEISRKFAVINPIISLEEGEQIGQEGCLSVPGFSFEICRPHRVIASGQDIDGSRIVLEVEDFEARCVSHEVDHLDGKLLLTRVTPQTRDLIERKFGRRIKREEP